MLTTAALNAIAAALTVYAQVSGLLDSIKVDPETGAREVGASFGGVAEQVLEAILAQLDAAHFAGVTVTNFHGVDAQVRRTHAPRLHAPRPHHRRGLRQPLDAGSKPF